MTTSKPPLMLPMLELPAETWEKLPWRVGTRTIVLTSGIGFALLLLASYVWGDYGYLERQAQANGDLYSAVLARWIPAGLTWALLLSAAAERRSAWFFTGISVVAAIYVPNAALPHALFWWISAALFLCWAIVTSLPSAVRLLKLATLSRRARHSQSGQRVPVKRGMTRRSIKDGYIRSMAPLWLPPLTVFIVVSMSNEYSLMQASNEPREIAWEYLDSRTWSALAPAFVVGSAIWSAVGLCRLSMQRLIGSVVWLLPESEKGPLRFLHRQTDNNGMCTLNAEVAAADAVPCPANSTGRTWLGYMGGDNQGDLLQWNDRQELIRHRCPESTGTEMFRGIRCFERIGARRQELPGGSRARPPGIR